MHDFPVFFRDYMSRIIRNLIILSFLYYGVCWAKLNACEKGSCLPGTGNLLVGRESRLTASSTCGLTSKNRYCIVTNLEDKKKCFWCDSKPQYSGSNLSHRIENVVPKSGPRKQLWWQSQNGVENVTIQLNLEAEFHFTHLYMKFKTFRPAAMLVERSYDFGKTWKVYRYLAYDCDKYFPYVPKGPQSNLTVVFCDETYSAVTPITDGEVILKILPTTLEAIDPYSSEVQNLVKITNLRVNFTKLHTLGDDLLDNRVEIQEKYYYAIWEMIVGGSCSCYGHADRCVPQDAIESRQNMVHGQCECTHNTRGLNCEKCDDFYNDVDWAPAVGKQTNACKRCNCNNHATSCHFDKSVFESTGRISGGVCDDCQHNTMGRNCEQCKHFFYQDPNKDFSSPDVCLKCDCDPAGSTDDGICDSRTDYINGLESGKCHCKVNVQGRRCDQCKNGYWNFTEANPYGCQACSCNIYGTYDNQGCNKENGECTCKRNVIGRDCNQCLPDYWGLGESHDGCQPCECDPGGSLDNNCDVINGQCRCRPNLTGRKCENPEQGFFARPLDFLITEAEVARCEGTCRVDVREPFYGGTNKTWTGSGFVHVLAHSYLDFPVEIIDKSMEYYPIIRYEPQIMSELDKVQVIIEEINATDLVPGICGHKSYYIASRDVALSPTSGYTVISPPVCLEKGRKYNVRLTFSKSDDQTESPTASILIDSLVLVPRIESIQFMHGSSIADQRQREFEESGCADAIYSVVKGNVSEICKKIYYSIGVTIHDGAYPCACDSIGSYNTYCDALGGHCRCKSNVIGRTCDKCAPGTYGFSLDGCKACDCHSVGASDNFCDIYTGQCKCRAQTYGRVCDQCQPGSWNYPNCQRCMCHGHADTCDPYNGACISCANYTEGSHCDRCVEGYYGDPRLNVNIPCRKCSCPGTVDTGHSYARHCILDPRTQDVVCQCDPGYTGTRCEICANNYYGNPEVLGGKCTPCNCSNNVDTTKPGNCDPHTGKCLQCLFNTEGFNCEVCRAGYYGDAIQKLCKGCSCSLLGTDSKQGTCDRVSGQCPCLPNVIGLNCDQCTANHWKIASGVGCELCLCDPIGSKSEQCDTYDGHCDCKQGFGGRKCDQCESNYWGDPNQECYACDCNPAGSAKLQCHQNNGTCVCRTGIGGDKCDKCARGYLGVSPNCTACGECFDNWDAILNNLDGQTDSVIAAAMEIMKTGATGSYTKEFESVEKKIEDIKQLLQNTTASSEQLKTLDKLIEDAKSDLMVPSHLLTNVRNQVGNITDRITTASVELSDLNTKSKNLNMTALNLKNNITKLQESNVEGALHLTREAYDKSMKIKDKNMVTESTIYDAERQCKSTETLIDHTIDRFTQGIDDNKKHMQQLRNYGNDIEKVIPSLNQQVCDKAGNPCDSLCGGAGCGFCGGLSCDNGAYTKSENALKYAEDAKKYINEKETKSGELYRAVTQAMTDSKAAAEAARIANDKVDVAKNASEMIIGESADLTNKLDKFLTLPRTTPSNIKDRATQALEKNIQLQPDEIRDLAKRINDTISSLTNIPAILNDTADDLNQAQMLKERADIAKMEAVHILDTAEQVVKALKDAESSQTQAESAIQAANSNILLAKDDLNQIFDNTTDAQRKANSTATDVNSLLERLKKVQTDFLKNDRDSNEIKDELKAITDDINDVQNKTFYLKLNYEQVSNQLDDHKRNSSNIRLAAQTLLDKAGQLSANTTSKLKEISESEFTFGDQDNQLLNLKAIIEKLMKRMTENYEKINEKFDAYSNCI